MNKNKQDKGKQNIIKIHDKFFKKTFYRLVAAQSFIEEPFSQEIKEKLNFEDLKRVPDSFIDDELEEYLSNIIYHTNLAEQGTSECIKKYEIIDL